MPYKDNHRGTQCVLIEKCNIDLFGGGSKNWNSQNTRNPPKVTKSSVYINLIPPSATKSTYMKRKLSKSNVSSHEINSFHEIQYCLRYPRSCMHSMEIIRAWSTRMLKFKLEASSISSTVHVRWPIILAVDVDCIERVQRKYLLLQKLGFLIPLNYRYIIFTVRCTTCVTPRIHSLKERERELLI